MLKGLEKLSVSQKFVVLALAAEKILKDQPVVFYYFGPRSLKKRAADLEGEKIASVIDELRNLEEETCLLDDSSPLFRRSYLRSQIKSLWAFLRYSGLKLTGETLTSAVNEVIGVSVVKPYDLNEAKNKLRKLLSGIGYSSYEQFKKERAKGSGVVKDSEIRRDIKLLKDCCENDIVPNILFGDRLVKKLRSSKVDISKPKKGYPSCYYIYRGHGLADMRLSGQHRYDKISVVQSLMHELYPGHHFFYVYRELLFEMGFLGEEATIDLLYSAETPLNEGIAEAAYAYLESLDAELLKYIKVAMFREQFCKKVLYNVWYRMYVDGDFDRANGCDYLMSEGFIENEKIKGLMEMIDNWRVYYPAYTIGREIVSNYLDDTGKKGLYHLYLPKPLSILAEKNNERRGYEEKSCASILCSDRLVE
ncbi:MAG: hypothetical protein HYU98_07975 [Deltaproteobacteria bacterium]|nr:hypothetical protein [Deltaproteobacteria bacterium]